MDDLIGISRKSKIFNILKPPSASLNYNKGYLKKLVYESDKKVETIIEIGSGGRKLSSRCINLDISGFNHVNVVCNGFFLPIKDNSVDFIVITAVLEHVAYPDRVVHEIYRILKTEGKVYVENPFLCAFHADPLDYQRYTIEGLKNLFSDFEVIESGVCVGPFSATAFFLRKFFTIFFKNVFLAKMIEFIVAWLTFWIKYFDWIFKKVNKIHIVASGIYLLLKKTNGR